MIKVKYTTKQKYTIIIPLPYFILYVASSLITWSLIWNKMINTLKSDDRKELTDIRKNVIGPLIKELQNNRGLVLVDIKNTDGVRMVVQL